MIHKIKIYGTCDNPRIVSEQCPFEKVAHAVELFQIIQANLSNNLCGMLASTTFEIPDDFKTIQQTWKHTPIK